MASNSSDRFRLKCERDRENPERKFKEFDFVFTFEEIDVSIIIDNHENAWFKAVDLARALELEDPNNGVYQTMDKTYCRSYETLSSLFENDNIQRIHPKTMFVNEMGLNSFIDRSRKPRAEAFRKWIYDIVLPSIRKKHRCGDDNLYREMNELLKRQLEESNVRYLNLENRYINLENKNTSLENKNTSLETKNTSLETKNTSLETKNTSLENKNTTLEKEKSILNNEIRFLHNDVRKYVDKLFEMKPSCVPTLENEVKQEYFVVYRKYGLDDDVSFKNSFQWPYYACRVQLDSLEQRRQELLVQYPNLVKLLQLAVPNSVIFFNYVLEKMPEYIERETKGQSFRIHIMTENQVLTRIENLHRTLHGEVTLNKK